MAAGDRFYLDRPFHSKPQDDRAPKGIAEDVSGD
jgi:hypothetical protein